MPHLLGRGDYMSRMTPASLPGIQKVLERHIHCWTTYHQTSDILQHRSKAVLEIQLTEIKCGIIGKVNPRGRINLLAGTEE